MSRFNPDQLAVPYLSKTQIKREVAVLLAEYAKRFGPVIEPPVPVDDILEVHLKVQFELFDLQKEFGAGDVLGGAWFFENMVRVDLSLDPATFPQRMGRYRFTLGHEIGHWRLHRRLYADEYGDPRHFETPCPAFICRSSDRSKPVEWQANYFAGHLLMPTHLLRAEWEDWHGSLAPLSIADMTEPARASVDHLSDVNRYLWPLAKRFEVSTEALRIRLRELELISETRKPAIVSMRYDPAMDMDW